MEHRISILLKDSSPDCPQMVTGSYLCSHLPFVSCGPQAMFMTLLILDDTQKLLAPIKEILTKLISTSSHEFPFR